MAEIISEVLGKPVRFQQIPGGALKQRMLDAGMSDAMAQGLIDMWAAKDSGLTTPNPALLSRRPRRASTNGAKKCSSRPPWVSARVS
jgi:uncharacterized protein YbjT (DUF2867 family)